MTPAQKEARKKHVEKKKKVQATRDAFLPSIIEQEAESLKTIMAAAVSMREAAIFRLILMGYPNKEIAHLYDLTASRISQLKKELEDSV